MFSIVVAGLDCFQIPFGTALGVFTIIVLSRKLSVHCIPVLSRADMQVCGALDGCHQGKPISFG